MDADESYEEVSLMADFLRIDLLSDCTLYKPIKLRQIYSDAEYDAFSADSFSGLPCSYPRREREFVFHHVSDEPLNRFIELLPSLTLFHFSKSSKELYYACLEVRGLEFKKITVFEGKTVKSADMSGFEGKLTSEGSLQNTDFINYQVCQNKLEMSVFEAVKCPEFLRFTKKYKILDLVVYKADDMDQVCSPIFHPGLEHASISFSKRRYGWIVHEDTITRKMFLRLLYYCTNLKSLEIKFHFSSHQDHVSLTQLQEFEQLRDPIERWFKKTTRMDLFFFYYMGNVYKMHQGQLKQCVKLYGICYLKMTCLTGVEPEFDKRYGAVRKDCLDLIKKFPRFYVSSYYQDVLEALLKEAEKEKPKITSNLEVFTYMPAS